MPQEPDPQRAAQIELLHRAVAVRPGAASLCYDLAERLIENGEIAEGVRFYRQAFRIEPQLRPLSITASPAEQDRIASRTAILADALIGAGVTVPAVLLARAWSAAVLNDPATVVKLIDVQAFLRVERDALSGLLAEPFRSDLVAEIVSGMTSHSLPWTAIKQARRNSQVFTEASPFGSRLARALRGEIDRHMQALGPSDHPFVAGRPAGYELQGWCVTFDGASRHISHIHPNAWLSGVFYLETGGVLPGDDRHRGWLRIGAPDGIGPESGWPEVWVEPKPGTLVLMPSCFTHETMPTETDGPRICIAFDAVPIPDKDDCLEEGVQLSRKA